LFTLSNYHISTKANGNTYLFSDDIKFRPFYDSKRVFSVEEENELAQYLLTASKHHHGLSTTATRTLAHEYAKRNQKTYPGSWDTNGRAGEEWLQGFLKRNPELSIRAPEATSLGRATSFNKTNVTNFFSQLEDVLKRHEFTAMSIYNVDETALTTVHKPPKVIVKKGEKQVGQITSAERGTLVTLCACVNAMGNTIPPFMIFPRVNFRELMTKDGPPGTVGVAHQSG